MSVTTSSVAESLAFLRRNVPRFDALRRAASWPGPLARFLVARRLPAATPPDDAVAALRLVQRDDRAFCRAVQLDGWRDVSVAPRAVFELQDDGAMLWPVSVRALVLFAGAERSQSGASQSGASQSGASQSGASQSGASPPRRLLAPADDDSVAARSDAGPDVRRFTVRTESRGDGGFRVVVR